MTINQLKNFLTDQIAKQHLVIKKTKTKKEKSFEEGFFAALVYVKTIIGDRTYAAL